MASRSSIHRLVFTLIMASLPLWGCSTSLPENEARDILTKYFEARGYKVIALDIGTTGSTPLKEQRYMGTEGYSIDIRSLTLEITADAGEPWNYRKGQHLTFTNASVRIRKRPDTAGWTVGTVDGIAVR